MIRAPQRTSRRHIGRTAAAALALIAASSCAFADDLESAGDPFEIASPASQSLALETASVEPAGHGLASFYSHLLSGRRTASGERYDPEALTAAHRSLPMGTRIRITNASNDRSVVVTVNDRGPFSRARLVDVSAAAANALGMKASGVVRVVTQVLAKGSRGDEAMPPLQADARTARDLILARD